MCRQVVEVPIKFPRINDAAVVSRRTRWDPSSRSSGPSDVHLATLLIQSKTRRRRRGSSSPRRAACFGFDVVAPACNCGKPGPWCASGVGWRRSSWRPWGGTCVVTVMVAVGRTREHDGRRRPRGARGAGRGAASTRQPSRGVPQRFRASPRGRLGDEGPTRSTRDSCQTAAAMRPSAANPAAAKAAARTGISSALPPRRSVMVGRGVGVVGAGVVGARRRACALARAPVEAGGEQDAVQQAVLRHRWRVNAETLA